MFSSILLASTLLGLTIAAPNTLLPRQSTINCPGMNNTIVISNGESFIIECGIDHAGGDLPNQPVYVNDLAQCINACAQNPQCVDVTLSGSACYMKGSVGPTVYDGFNGARSLGVQADLVYLTCGTLN